MNRFAGRRHRAGLLRGLLLPILLFALVIGGFSWGVGAFSQTARREQLGAVRQAVVQAAVHCYAVEGLYPSDLGYLRDHYGLMLDDEKYAVHYNCFASNLMPDIDVIPK